MRFESIRDILGYIEECHIALVELYKRLSLESNDDKVRLLLYFLENKEQLSYQYIHDYVQQAPLPILETWVDNIFDKSFPLRCQQLQLQADISIDDVIGLAMTFDSQLIELLQDSAYKSPTLEGQKALQNITSQEQQTLHQVLMARNEFVYM